MMILNQYPPNYDAIIAAFPYVDTQLYVLFCYGDTIYNPSGKKLPPEKILHEMVHAGQQRTYGVEAWWDRYLIDATFRYEQEIPAYQVEYREFCRLEHNKQDRFNYLHDLAWQISSPLYGSLVSKAEALKVIVNHGN